MNVDNENNTPEQKNGYICKINIGLKILAILLFNAFLGMFVHDFIMKFESLDYSLLYLIFAYEQYEQLLSPNTWLLLLWVTEGVLGIFCVSTIIMHKKFFILICAEVLFVIFVFIYLLGMFIGAYGGIFTIL